MFENFENFKNKKTPAWAYALVMVAIAAHVAFGGVVVVSDMWKAPLLDVPPTPLEVSIAPPPPPPPPPPKGGRKLDTQKPKEPKKIKVLEPVQPVKVDPIKPPEPVETEGTDDPAGEEGGEEGGVEGGVVGGVVGGAGEAPPPPPPVVVERKIVAPAALEASRISGEKMIYPDDVTKTEIQRSGKTKFVVNVMVCLNRAGIVETVEVKKKRGESTGSGYQAYDNKLEREIRKWRYRPFMVDGNPAPVCSMVQFIYSQK